MQNMGWIRAPEPGGRGAFECPGFREDDGICEQVILIDLESYGSPGIAPRGWDPGDAGEPAVFEFVEDICPACGQNLEKWREDIEADFRGFAIEASERDNEW